MPDNRFGFAGQFLRTVYRPLPYYFLDFRKTNFFYCENHEYVFQNLLRIFFYLI